MPDDSTADKETGEVECVETSYVEHAGEVRLPSTPKGNHVELIFDMDQTDR